MTSTNQFDLPAFKAFVAGKDPDEEYDPTDSNFCALTQFCEAADIPAPRLLFWSLPRPLRGAICGRGDDTFGSLLSRLNNLPADPPTAAEGGDDYPVSALTPLNGERA